MTAKRPLSVWAAGQMGLIGDAAKRYALSVVDPEIAAHDDGALIGKIRDDFVTSGSSIPEERIRRQLALLGARAYGQILADISDPAGRV
jgi:hypothetical protein